MHFPFYSDQAEHNLEKIGIYSIIKGESQAIFFLLVLKYQLIQSHNSHKFTPSLGNVSNSQPP